MLLSVTESGALEKIEVAIIAPIITEAITNFILGVIGSNSKNSNCI
jgi:hypothetical protein